MPTGVETRPSSGPVLTDDLIQRHLGVGNSDDPSPSTDPQPADSPVESEDNPVADAFLESEDEVGGNEEDVEEVDEPEADDDLEDGNETEGDESEDETPEDEDSEATKSELFSKFSKKDMETIEANPSLKRAYKSMVSDYTQKTQEVAALRKESEAVKMEAESFKEDYNKFGEMLQSDEGMEKFLVDIALARSEVFDRAMEKAAELSENEGQKNTYLREKELEEREQKLRQEEDKRSKLSAQQRIEQIVSLTKDLATKSGMTGAEIRTAEQYVANRILENRLIGKGDVTDEDVQRAVADAAKDVEETRAAVRRRVEQELRKKNLSAQQKKARDAKRPAPPRAGAPLDTPTPERGSTKEDPLRKYLTQRLGA